MVGGGKSARFLTSYDMTKASKERNLSGTYIEFVDDHSKRLKKPFQGFPEDAAGLLNGARWHGRSSPSKGKTISRPEDGKEASNKQPRNTAQATWNSSDVLLQRPSSAPPTILKPTKKLVQSSFASHLHGGGVIIKPEVTEPEVKRSRGKGAASPDVTVNRTRRHVVVEPGSQAVERSSIMGQKQLGLRTFKPMGRPGTADSFLSHKLVPTSDLLPAKLETERMPTPASQPFNQSASKEVYFDSFNDYCLNKSRSIYGGRFRFN